MEQNALCFLTVSQLAARIERGELSPVELVESCLTRVQDLNRKFNAFITVTAEQARRGAGEAEREIRIGRYRGPFHGIPFALKDLIDVEGIPTTAASKILKDNVSRRTATTAHRLIQSGGVLLGKTNLQEFARGPTGVESYFGPTANPWNPFHIAGGSSSGSGASIAGGMVPVALGTDTGGSVRIPAALSGIVGIRPTYGRVSRHGVFPLGLSFDALGPMTRSVEDAAMTLSLIAGYDLLDPSTAKYPVPDYRASLGRGVEGLRLGVPSNFFFPGYNKEVEQRVWDAIGVLQTLGAEIQEVRVPFAEYGWVAYLSIVGPESVPYHREFLRSRRRDYMKRTPEFFELSLFIPGWRYEQGKKARVLFVKQAAELFREVDALLTPTVPVPAPPIQAADDWPPLLHCTIPFSVVGVPALSVPCGFTESGLPVGLQIVGKWWEEELLFRIGAAYERATDWHKRFPRIAAN